MSTEVMNAAENRGVGGVMDGRVKINTGGAESGANLAPIWRRFGAKTASKYSGANLAPNWRRFGASQLKELP